MPPEDAGEQLIQACGNCSSLLDVTEYDPLSQIACPVCGTTSRVERMFNQFTLLDVLGEGGMGTVFRALDTSLNRTVALKLLRREFSHDQEYLNKLDTEAKITASISHPHVVKVYSFGSDHGQFYLAMELVDKGTLDDLIELQGRVAELQTLEVGIQAASGLHAAHQRGLIHRDVKPGNILFADAHNSKISDFGLAILAEREAEVRGEIWGTPYYVAPEKLTNLPEDHRSDIYSLGATLFHALAGRPPFDADTASMVALKHLKAQTVSLQAFAPDVAEQTAYVINRMLHKDPMQRYQTYEELLEHLRYAYDAVTVVLQSGGGREKQRVVIETQEQQTFVGWMTFALLILVVGAGIALFAFRDKLFSGVASVEVATDTSLISQAPKALTRGEPQAVTEKLKEATRDASDSKKRAILRLLYATSVLMEKGDAGVSYLVLAEAAPYSTSQEEGPLANTLVEIGRRMSKADPIPTDEAAKLPNTGPQSIALLVYGLKNWQLDQTTNAIPFFERFLAGDPGEKWVEEFRPLASGCLSDAQKILNAWKDLKTASSDQRRSILAELSGLSQNPGAPGVLAKVTVGKVKDLGARSTSSAGVQPQNTPPPRNTQPPSVTPTPAQSTAQPAFVTDIPAPWKNLDIGGVGAPGAAIYSNGTFSVSGSGADIYKKLDEFQFVYQEIKGDFQISATVTSMENPAKFAKAGIMIRDKLETGATYFTINHLGITNNKEFLTRTAENSEAVSLKRFASGFPSYSRVIRQGRKFTGMTSRDGIKYEVVATATIPMGETVYTGLVTCSHSDGNLVTATFDRVTIEPVDTSSIPTTAPADNATSSSSYLPEPWKDTNIGFTVPAGGTDAGDEGMFTLRGGGMSHLDELHFLYQEAVGDCEITARLASLEETHKFAKAFVSIRENLEPNPKLVQLHILPNFGIGYESRSIANTPKKSESVSNAEPPFWLRLKRKGNTFSGAISRDNVTWTELKKFEIDMGPKTVIGLGVCSHIAGKTAQAVFDNVTVTP